MKVRKAVIPAAGLGTRLLSATKAVPKEMLPIVRKPAIQMIVEECVAAGIELVVFVTGRYKGALEDHFDVSYEVEDILRLDGKTELLNRIDGLASMVDIVSVRQNRPLGLGHAVHCAHSIIDRNEPFAVLLPDDIIDAEVCGTAQLVEAHHETGQGVLGLFRVPEGTEHMYGIVTGEELGGGRYQCRSMVEKPPPGTAASNLAIVGRYVLPGSIFDHLESTTPGSGGEIQLTDALVRLMESEGVVGHVLRGTRYDTGDVLGLIEANVAFAMKDPELAGPLRERLLKYV